MGLAAPKNKIKLSNDPNNTKWLSDDQSFGRKIMASQGWKPGEYLGAKNAPHAEFHTAANASHIRVAIKDDNLGLGAKIGSGVGHGECTGLDAFKNLLGRLNGKDEDEIEKEQKSREDLKRAIYTERRWGSIRFVQGGFLVGDKIQDLIEGETERVRKLAEGRVESESDSVDSSDSSDSESESEPEPVVKEPKKSKKRKLDEQEGVTITNTPEVKKSKKRKLKGSEDVPQVVAVKAKKSKMRKSKASPDDAAQVVASERDTKRLKKKKSKREDEVELGAEVGNRDEVTKTEKRKERKEKKDRQDKDSLDSDLGEDAKRDERKKKKKKSRQEKQKEDIEPLSESAQPVQLVAKGHSTSTPSATDSGRSTPIMMQGRHAVRARNIAQKRLASMDVASLNQIFMIKS